MGGDSNPREGHLEITGTQGSYIMTHATWKRINHEGETTVLREGRNPPSEGWKLYQNIADHFTQKTPLIITPEWSRRPIHIIDLANQSARKGRALAAKHR